MPKINQLKPATSLANTDIMIADTSTGSDTRKIAYSDLRAQVQNESKSVFALKGEVASDDQVADAVGDWLDTHVTPTGSAVAIDDTLKIQGAAADAKAAGEIIVVNGTSGNGTRVNITTTDTDIELAEMSDVAELKSAFTQLSDLTVKTYENTTTTPVTTTFTSGYMNVNGVVTASDSYHYTSKLTCKSGDIFSTPGTSIRFVTAFSGDSVVSAAGSSTTVSSYTVPDGIDGVVLTLYSTVSDFFKTETIKTSENILNEDITNIYTLIGNLSESVIGKNILNPDEITNGYYISSSDGTLTASASYWVSDFIPVEPSTTYTFSELYSDQITPSATRYICLFYDENKDPITSAYTNNTGRGITVISPSTAKYARVSSTILSPLSGYDVIYQFEKSSAFTGKAPYTKSVYLKDPANYLAGKKWVSCGDSFTKGDFSGLNAQQIWNNCTIKTGKYAGENRCYPFIIGNRNNMVIVNEAVNGSTMCLNDGTHNAFSTVGGRYTQIPEDADYITLYFGINDGNYSSPIGSIDDTDNTTFYGAWNVVLDYLMRNHPFAKIGIIVTNGTSMAYINAEKAVAEKWGIPYLDMNGIQTPVMNRSNNQSITNAVREFRTQAFSVNAPSNTHPSAKAHEYESTFIEDFLRRL